MLLSQKNILESQVNELRRDLTLERFEHAATRERLEERTVGLSDAHAAMEELAELRRQLEQQIAEHHVEFGKGENSAASFRVKIATLERQVEHYKAQYVDMKDQVRRLCGVVVGCGCRLLGWALYVPFFFFFLKRKKRCDFACRP